MKNSITLNAVEIQSGLSRVKLAEGLISQLPVNHDSRNTWLLNYGTSLKATQMRIERDLGFDLETESCEITK
jgi:hypothetical protein